MLSLLNFLPRKLFDLYFCPLIIFDLDFGPLVKKVGTERQRDRETERQRDRETERQEDNNLYHVVGFLGVSVEVLMTIITKRLKCKEQL